jgi:hypothetical protein
MTFPVGPWVAGGLGDKDTLNAAFVQYGTAAQRPSPVYENQMYFATDTAELSQVRTGAWASIGVVHAAIGPDGHHPILHSHNGVDGSGTVTHADTTGKTDSDHHPPVHAHNGIDGSGTVDHADLTNLVQGHNNSIFVLVESLIYG